jgi:hypothetical protein
MIDLTLLLALLTLLQLKHYLADFHWQTAWMVAGKGGYGRLGGLAHAGLHGALSLPVLLLAGLPAATVAGIAAGEAVVHYHIDWTKTRIQAAHALEPHARRYWQLLGADQAAHQLTYVAMIWVAARLVPGA